MTSENALFAEWNVEVIITDLHAKMDGLAPLPSVVTISRFKIKKEKAKPTFALCYYGHIYQC